MGLLKRVMVLWLMAAPSIWTASTAAADKPIAPPEILDVIRTIKPRVVACYKNQAQPVPAGTMMVSFVIQPDGHVSSVEILTPIYEGTSVGMSVAGIIKAQTFPPVQITPIKIDYPFILR